MLTGHVGEQLYCNRNALHSCGSGNSKTGSCTSNIAGNIAVCIADLSALAKDNSVFSFHVQSGQHTTNRHQRQVECIAQLHGLGISGIHTQIRKHRTKAAAAVQSLQGSDILSQRHLRQAFVQILGITLSKVCVQRSNKAFLVHATLGQRRRCDGGIVGFGAHIDIDAHISAAHHSQGPVGKGGSLQGNLNVVLVGIHDLAHLVQNGSDLVSVRLRANDGHSDRAVCLLTGYNTHSHVIPISNSVKRHLPGSGDHSVLDEGCSVFDGPGQSAKVHALCHQVIEEALNAACTGKLHNAHNLIDSVFDSGIIKQSDQVIDDVLHTD